MRIPSRFRCVIFVFILVTLPLLAACDKDDETGTEPIQSPTPGLGIGSTWVYNEIYGDEVDTMTATIVGEEVVNGDDSYIIELQYDDPPVYRFGLGGFDPVQVLGHKHWYSKTTWDTNKFEATVETPAGIQVLYTNNYTHSGDVDRAQFGVGKSWAYDTKLDANPANFTLPPLTWRADVVAIEEITVPAGTFQCFKVEHTRIAAMGEDLPQAITYRTDWLSAEERFIGPVRIQDINAYDKGLIWELVSFSQFIESSG